MVHDNNGNDREGSGGILKEEDVFVRAAVHHIIEPSRH